MKYIILVIVILAIFVSPACATYYAEGIHVSSLDSVDDRASETLNISFEFPYYNINHTQFNVTSNGVVSFTGKSSTFGNMNLPTTNYNCPAVFPFWDDLISSDGYILYESIASGDKGNPYGTDALVVQWTNYGFFSSELVMGTFQVHLVSDGNITFNYNDLISPTRSYGQSATIGIQENGTGNYVQHSINADAGIRSGYAITFAYDDGVNYTKSGASTDDFWDILLYKNGSVQPPTKPYAPNPSVGATTSTSPTLSWSSENATNYTVRVSVNSDLSSPIYSNSTFTESPLSLSSLSANTTYYWHIIAQNNGGEAHSDLWNFTTSSVPVASFTSNVTNGAVPLTINFTDISINTPISWSWDFGDGNTSTDQNATHTYVAAGTYNVSLNATNADGSNIKTQINYITAAVAPVASFTSNVTSGAIPFSVNFTDLSTNAPNSWSWDFGDGNTSTAQNPTHSYVSTGTYNVSLNATNVGGSNVSTQLSYISVAATPVANFTADVTSGTAPLAVSFTDFSNNTPTSWAWNFGDGVTSTDKNATHTYTTAGTYTVVLNATNVGGSNTSIQTGYITVTAVSSSSSSDSSYRASVGPSQPPETVTFTDTSVQHVMGGTAVDFDLSEGDDPVLGISFDAKDNEGLVVTKVQVLKGEPSDIPAPAGNSYSVMSIDVGSEGTISEHNADNIMIRFKVSWEWINENSIDTETIRMTRFHGEQWEDLPSNKISDDGEFLYFDAQTPGFSIFSVIGDSVGAEVVESEPESIISEEEELSEPDIEEPKDTPGFTGMLSLVFVTLAFLLFRKNE
ncbi:PKD domain-containing protein [Methanolobus sp. ZRKC5]|uniref:PKD domain-containing protein n=1 Tax=unclassified Methanolobus TaxID=2629569 RepID=UPI00313CF334